MTEWIWFNGETIPLSEARISVEDRGFQFADGVYEVVRLYGGKPFTLAEHLDRLRRSAAGIQIDMPLEVHALAAEIVKFLAKANIAEGMIYLQLTRGACPRNHLFPHLTTQGRIQPTLLFYARPLPSGAVGTGEGMKLLSVPDERWKRCWVKSIALLPNVLAKSAAAAVGADEAVFVEDGFATECASSNFFAVIGGKLLTPPVGAKVLPGITRAILLECAAEMRIETIERPVKEREAIGADELFITSTTREVSWVAKWDDHVIGHPHCGPITRKMHAALKERIARK